MPQSVRLLPVWIWLALGGLIPALGEEGGIDVGDRKQLLIDHRFIAESKNVTLHMNRPRKMGAVLLPDKPWESRDIGFCVTVLEHEGQYKMWYLALTGQFTTPPLTFSGNRLVLNANTGAAGTCKVEILDAKGNPLDGHSLDDCDEIGGNFIEKTVTWKGKAAVKSPDDRPVRLRFVMRAGKLFSFRFAAAE